MSRHAPDSVTVKPLGAGCEVGRSCLLLDYTRIGHRGRIILDCGFHPALAEAKGAASIQCLPFFDAIDDLSTIGAILITHFHNDHIGALPYLYRIIARAIDDKNRAAEQTGDQKIPYPPIYMTDPTLAVFLASAPDLVKQVRLYDLNDVDLVQKHTRTIKFNQHETVQDVGITAYPAGHVVGACMFQIDIDGYVVLYTGDFSSEREDRHLAPAEPPQVRPDLLIIESTYGDMEHPSRATREHNFIASVRDTLLQKGTVLVPVFAIGRVQELMRILEEHWRANYATLGHFKIYYVSNLAKKSNELLASSQAFMKHNVFAPDSAGGSRAGDIIQYVSGPFRTPDNPCVIFCTPGMLQSGTSRDVFEALCPKKENTLIATGYATAGTLLDTLLQEPPPSHIYSKDRKRLERAIEIKEISFSAHSDIRQTKAFLDRLMPKDVILVHGSAKAIDKLYRRLKRDYAGELSKGTMRIHPPQNNEAVTINMQKGVLAKLHMRGLPGPGGQGGPAGGAGFVDSFGLEEGPGSAGGEPGPLKEKQGAEGAGGVGPAGGAAGVAGEGAASAVASAPAGPAAGAPEAPGDEPEEQLASAPRTGLLIRSGLQYSLYDRETFLDAGKDSQAQLANAIQATSTVDSPVAPSRVDAMLRSKFLVLRRPAFLEAGEGREPPDADTSGIFTAREGGEQSWELARCSVRVTPLTADGRVATTDAVAAPPAPRPARAQGGPGSESRGPASAVESRAASPAGSSMSSGAPTPLGGGTENASMVVADERPVDRYQIEYTSADEAVALSVALGIARLAAEAGEGEEGVGGEGAAGAAGTPGATSTPAPAAPAASPAELPDPVTKGLREAQDALLGMLREQYLVTEVGGPGTGPAGGPEAPRAFLVSDLDRVASLELVLGPGGVWVEGPNPEAPGRRHPRVGAALGPALERWRALRLRVLRAWDAIRAVLLPLNY